MTLPQHRPDPFWLPPAWAFTEHCASPMAMVDREARLQSVNPALRDWLAAGTRSWRGVALAELDATPPRVCDAIDRAFAQQRRIWLREARLRGALGDHGVDLALTPLDARMLLLEVLPATARPTSRLSESLRGFAHEIRGPLAGMRGAAQLLQRSVDPPDRTLLAELIVGEVDRLAALSDRLLQAGAAPRLASVNIHEITERVAALVAAESPHPTVRRDYDPSLPALQVDADRVQQALLNLVRNALDAGAAELTLRTRAEHGVRMGEHAVRLAVRIDVADDGCGVGAAIADSLFEPLVSGRPDGNGLGLAIAREIAREHGGELDYVSRPGATVFSLLLPVSA